MHFIPYVSILSNNKYCIFRKLVNLVIFDISLPVYLIWSKSCLPLLIHILIILKLILYGSRYMKYSRVPIPL